MTATKVDTFTHKGSRPQPYKVVKWNDGSLTCDCPGWVYKKADKPRDCKHVRFHR